MVRCAKHLISSTSDLVNLYWDVLGHHQHAHVARFLRLTAVTMPAIKSICTWLQQLQQPKQTL